MEDYYWTIFRTTGAPIFYLLYRWALVQRDEAKTAWGEPQAELV